MKLKEKFHLQDQFYKSLNEPIQRSCQIIKKIGGNFKPKSCGFLNGEKMICMDLLYKAVMKDECLIYSFGLSDNWDFEIAMAKIGNNTGL